MIAFLATLASAAELRLASTPWPPFTGDVGQPRVVIELAEEAFRRAGIATTMTIVDEGTLTPKLQAKQFDGSPAMWKGKDRESFLTYSAPILENRLVLVGKKGSDVSAEKLSALKEKRVGIVAGYGYGEEVTQATDVNFVKGKSDQSNLEDLLAGKLDYIVVEDLAIHHMLDHQAAQAKAHLQIGRVPLMNRTLHLALRSDVPNAAKIIEAFNAKLNALLADGTYNRILQLSWIQADVDGDGKFELIPNSKNIGSEPPSDNYSIVAGGSNQPSQYWVDGKAYANWEKVPKQYKNFVDDQRERSTATPLLKF